jgi:hypothetical protein
VVRRRDRLLVAVFWVRDTCVFGAVLVLSSECPPFGFNRLRFYDFASFTDDFFHNLTDADVFLSSALTSTTIRLSIHTAGFYDMRLLGLEKEGLGMLVWLE